MSEHRIKIGTLFSGIGAFEHALNQLHIKHTIQFACDCGERELPLKYSDLSLLTKGKNDDEILDFCTDYINRIGVKVEFREIEISLLNELIHQGIHRDCGQIYGSQPWRLDIEHRPV